MNRIKKGDTVKVIAGKDKDKSGEVLLVLTKEDRVIVSQVNMVKRHRKARTQGQQSGIFQQESPLHISNVMLVCTQCGQPTRAGVRVNEADEKVRFCKKCQKDIE